MAIEIRQLSIKSNVVQQAGGSSASMGSGGGNGGSDGSKPTIGSACRGQSLDEDTRSDIMAECRALVLELLSRARER